MDRKQFLKRSVQAGLCCCGAAAGLGRSLSASPAQTSDGRREWIDGFERRMVKGSETTASARIEKAERWIKHLMDHMDTQLDLPTRNALMQACGRSCFIDAFGVASTEKPSPEQTEKVLLLLQQRGYEVKREGDATVIHYSWGRDHQNPWGLILHDGYCMCPIVETGPPGLSPTYCQCSTGYVKESMERSLGRPVKVELLESLKMGGRDCRFRIEVADA